MGASGGIIPTTLFTNPPTISTLIPPAPPPPPPGLPPPPPSPPPPGLSPSITLFPKTLNERDLEAIKTYNENFIEGEDPEYIDDAKMIEVRRLKETGLYNINKNFDTLSGKITEEKARNDYKIE